MNKLKVAVVSIFALPVIVVPAAAQAQVLLADDFEQGLSHWTVEDVQAPPTPLWHLSEAGECGLGISRMAAFSLPEPVCTYAEGAVDVDSTLFSEPFVLLGNGPYHLQLTGIYSSDFPPTSTGTACIAYLEDLVTGEQLPLLSLLDPLQEQPGVLAAASKDFDLAPEQAAHPMRLCIQGLVHTVEASSGTGTRLDDILLRSSAYQKFGEPLPGLNQFFLTPMAPLLEGYGPLVPGSANELRLWDLQPNSVAVLVFGLQLLELPFKGGVMYPEPGRLLIMQTGDTFFGIPTIDKLPFTLPALPPGTELFMQLWVQDPTAVQGWAASQGLKGVTG